MTSSLSKTNAATSNAEDASVLSFYPNLGHVVKVRVLDSEPIFASTDLLTANFERRHMVDSMFLRSLVADSADDGVVSMSNLVDPTPPVNRIWGTRNDSDRVVGMLPRRLVLTLFSGPIQGWVQFKLQNVLVVDRLPVPFNLSLKALDFWPEDERMYRFGREIFPPQYHSYPYWNPKPSDPKLVGSDWSEGPERTDAMAQAIVDNATGRCNKMKKGEACTNCGKSWSTKQCILCASETYCGKECQQARWKVHKKICSGRKKNRRLDGKEGKKATPPNNNNNEKNG